MTNEELKTLQKTLLNILQDFDTFCKDNDLKYCLIGGTALGAVRHNGFIPWDDDIDVGMTYENYHRFIELARSQFNNGKYYFEEENTKAWPSYHSKIKLNNTTFVEGPGSKNTKHLGIFLDVFCFYNTPDDPKLRKKQFFRSRLLIAKALSKENYKTNNLKKRLLITYARLFISEKKKDRLFRQVTSFENTNTKDYMVCFDRGRMESMIYPKPLIDHLSLHQFEDCQFPIPSDFNAYLTIGFGDYMKLPPKEQQHPSHVAFISFDHAYSYDEAMELANK